MAGEGRNLAALPKAELHIHLEGAMRPDTLTELCAKHGVERPDDTRGKRFSDFGPFALCYIAVCECLREEEDVFRLVREVAEDAAASGASWIEPHLSFTFYSDRFGGLEAALKVLLRAAEAAEVATGVGIGYIVAFERSIPGKEDQQCIQEAEALAAVVRSLADSDDSKVRGHGGLVAVGLHGAEPGHPPEPFTQAFATACATGLPAVPHAGEIAPSPGGGPASVRFCVDKLHAKRLGHGVLAVEDAALVEHLAAKQVCLDICPSSNYLLRVVDALADHPLPRLAHAGIPCTINSDDPLLFGSSLLNEYQSCRDAMGLSDDDLADCARNSFLYSAAPEDIKRRGLDGIDAWLAKKPRSSAL